MKLSTTFHPHKDEQEESRTQTLEDMLRACVIDYKGNWDDHLPLFSSIIIIATIPVLGWHLLKNYMVGDVGP